MNDYLPVLVVLGLGGLVLYVLTRQQQPPPVVNTTPAQQCGASYMGVGASVPCQLLGAGIKELSAEAQKVLSPVTQNLKAAASGIKPWEYVITPVAISHAAYNEGKKVLDYINPF